MSDPTSAAAEVLATDALGPAPEVVWQDDVHLGFRTVVKDVLVFILDEMDGKGYAGLWSDHLEYLLEIQSSIERAAPVDAAIERLERGINEMARMVDRASREILRLPTGAPGGFALIFLAPVIQSDPRLAAEVNQTLQVWEDAARAATDHARNLRDTAERFRTETPDRVAELRQVIKQAEEKTGLDPLLKGRYLNRLQFIDLAVTRVVQPAADKAERAWKHAGTCWTAARNVGRFD